MLQFQCDYTQGCTPEILARLQETNSCQYAGYGQDEICNRAKEKIKKAVGNDDAQVFFAVGGTQTNQLVISAMLSSTEGVVAVETGHVAVHEAGAIEYSGHKVLTLPEHDGKMYAKELKALLEKFYADETFEHQVFPGMVYISHPTENGTLYTKSELEALYEICKEYKMPLFVDGARLGYALASYNTDVDLKTLAKLCDVFYIGGTKVGALFGEAIVFTKNNVPKHFFTHIKQHGALLAKGWLLGLMFDTLFTDNLYMKISKNAIDLAEYMKKEIAKKGYAFLLDSPTNQQFVILSNDKLKEISSKVIYSTWYATDENHTAVRFATSWATTKEQVDELLEML